MINIVLGTFYGDEGKGQTVHNLCKQQKGSTLVVRFSGGHQVGHTVRHNSIEHTFSNFGSGSLLGIPTYWSEYCTVDPITTVLELGDLNKLGVNPEIIYSPFCQVVTPFDVIAQRNDKENLAHGTVGTGYQTTLNRVKSGYSLTIIDCLNINVLRAKINSIRDHFYHFDTGDTAIEINIDSWCNQVCGYFNSVNTASFPTIARKYNNIVFEGSQGILLDQRFGIMPYCTPSNTTCQNAMELINSAEFLKNEQIGHWYVTRPYITRHGNGPLCTSTNIIEVNDPNNKFNDFQKSLRACGFDARLFAHAVKINTQFINLEEMIKLRVSYYDALIERHSFTMMVTHFDEAQPMGEIPELDDAMFDFVGNMRCSLYDEIISEESDF